MRQACSPHPTKFHKFVFSEIPNFVRQTWSEGRFARPVRLIQEILISRNFEFCSSDLVGRPVPQACSPGLFVRPVRQACSSGLFARPGRQACSPGLFVRPVRQACSSGLFARPVRQACSPDMLTIRGPPPPLGGRRGGTTAGTSRWTEKVPNCSPEECPPALDR